jgi:hypothetical protein
MPIAMSFGPFGGTGMKMLSKQLKKSNRESHSIHWSAIRVRKNDQKGAASKRT